jgi:hypothetical protein
VDGLGFLGLGASSGMITGFLVSKAKPSLGLGTVVAALLPVLLSGAAVLLLPQLASTGSSDLFPIGLILSLMWMQVGPLLMGAQSQSKLAIVLVTLYAVATSGLTIFALFRAL